MNRLIFVLLVVALPALATVPDPVNLEQLRVQASQGDVEAQYELGVLYEFGFQYPDHRVNAYVWYTRAAEQGHAQAARRLEVLKPQLRAAEVERAGKELSLAPTKTAAP
jgi:uncharacterized protein